MSIYKIYVDFIKNTQLTLSPEKWYFKSDPDYTYMLEHVSQYEGNQYLDIIKNNANHFYESNFKFLIDICNLNDKYGKTKKTNFQNFMTCSSTNLRYIFFSLLILEDMKKHKLNNINIIEIGGGYGGLCFFVHKIAKLYNILINSYTIFDLVEASNLQEKYLNALNIENVNFCQLDKYNNLIKNRFLISTYAFSEIPTNIQKEYSKEIINPYTKFGFIAWNSIPVYYFIENSIIEKEREYPLTGKYNYFVRYYKETPHLTAAT